MKLNASLLRIALLSGSMLLTLGPVSAQKHESRHPLTAKLHSAQRKTTKQQTSKPSEPSPTPTHGSPILEGTYTLDDPTASERINKGIEASVKDMSWLSRGTARSELEAANLPPPRDISISFTPTEVTITTDVSGTVKTSDDGTLVNWTWKGNKYKVSTKWENCDLVRTFKRSGRLRVNTYSLSDAGKTLNMHVSATGGSFGFNIKPLVYVLRYKRAS